MQATEHPILENVFSLVRRLKTLSFTPTHDRSRQSHESASRSVARIESGDSRGMTELPDSRPLQAALSEVYELLEEYGPHWYSEELRRRIQSALNSFRGNEKI
jgi:hypothetical protein